MTTRSIAPPTPEHSTADTLLRDTGAFVNQLLAGIGLHALGALILTVLYKVAITVKEKAGGAAATH